MYNEICKCLPICFGWIFAAVRFTGKKSKRMLVGLNSAVAPVDIPRINLSI